MEDLEFDSITHSMPIETYSEALDATIKRSNGEQTMSDEDVKLALLHAQIVLKHQQKLIDALIKDRLEQSNKKSFIKRLLKK